MLWDAFPIMASGSKIRLAYPIRIDIIHGSHKFVWHFNTNNINFVALVLSVKISSELLASMNYFLNTISSFIVHLNRINICSYIVIMVILKYTLLFIDKYMFYFFFKMLFISISTIFEIVISIFYLQSFSSFVETSVVTNPPLYNGTP